MKTLEQFDVETAKARAKLEREHSILATLPEGFEPSHIIAWDHKGEPWVTYKVKTLADALAIMRAFGELDFVSARESGCLSIARADEHGKQYADVADRWEIPECVELRQHGGRGFYSAEVAFHPVAPRVQVKIDVEQFPYQFRAQLSAHYSQHGEVSSVTFREPDLLRGQYTERVKFSGGSADAFDLRYYFSGADHFADILNLLPAQVAA